MKSNYKKQTKKNLERKLIKEKETNYMSNGKDVIIHLIAELIKMILNGIPLFKNELILS